MGKQKRKDKKGKGAEKTAAKTEKNANKKKKKLLREKGEDDIDSLIAEFVNADLKRQAIIEEKCQQPSPRVYYSWTLVENRNEIYLFGGEYFNGTKTFVYNDLFLFNIKNHNWINIKSPNPPPPRSAHQTVYFARDGGELWIFGGEFISPSQTQFRHYNDLWRFGIADRKWHKIEAKGGPSSRSGHRMILYKRNLIVFGGFHDNGSDCKYFNDLHIFDIESYTWVKVQIAGNPPSQRSGCQLILSSDQKSIILYGGYSKKMEKNKTESGITYSDMYILENKVIGNKMEDKQENVVQSVQKWCWSPIKQSGNKPFPRSGFMLISYSNDRAIFFGGVVDQVNNDDDDDIEGKFYNDLFILDVKLGKWYPCKLRSKKENKKLENNSKITMESSNISCTEMGTNLQENKVIQTFKDDVFTVTIDNTATSQFDDEIIFNDKEESSDYFSPKPRMNATGVIQNGILYMYGGLYELEEKQLTFSDMYSLDCHKFDEWKVIIPHLEENLDWQETDSNSNEDEQSVCSEDSPEDYKPPDKNNDEDISEYFLRTKDFWIIQAENEAEKSNNDELTSKQLKTNAMELAKLFFNN